MTIERIPILDLPRQYKQVGAELERRVLDVLRSGHYILGKNVVELEEVVSRLSGCRYGVGVANGTDALVLALWVLDVGPGDEVITTPFTFAATVEAIALRGAKAVFVDIDPRTFNINPDLIEPAITKRTKAIIPVHLYGQPADMESIMSIARRHKLRVIEDNAQAIGALYKGKPTGSFGDLACISFYPTKNLGACGDAGMLVTNDREIADRLKVLRAHGMRVRYYHDEVGVNSRLDELQAAALLAKVPFLPEWDQKRREVASLYDAVLAACPGIIPPAVTSDVMPVWHQYTIRVLSEGAGASRRDTMQKELSARGIDSVCYYPVPLHLQQAFAGSGYKTGDFKVTETVAQEVLSLPIYPELTQEQVERVGRAVKEIAGAQNSLPVTPAVAAQPTVVTP